MLLAVFTDDSAVDLSRIPEHQVAHRETAVHGIEQVANCSFLPDERPLDLRERQLPEVDVGEEVTQFVLARGEKRLRHPRRIKPPSKSSAYKPVFQYRGG